eukprot:4061621-Pyramimonas_sp.AAC.1
MDTKCLLGIEIEFPEFLELKAWARGRGHVGEGRGHVGVGTCRRVHTRCHRRLLAALAAPSSSSGLEHWTGPRSPAGRSHQRHVSR